jgi:hypothetical protein
MASKDPQTPAAVSAPDAPAAPALSFDQLMQLLQTAAAANQMSPEMLAGVIAKAVSSSTSEAHERASGAIAAAPDYHARSAFNPAGDFAAPRPPLIGLYYWCGYPLVAAELLHDEIALLQQLEPGHYGPHGAWTVTDLTPGMKRPEDKRFLITFPNKEPDQRSALPSMRDMLRLMVEEAKTTLVLASR